MEGTEAAPETVYGAFAQVAGAQPDAVAVRETGGALTFSQLDAMARSIAAALPEGARTVGVVCGHGHAQVAALLGVLAAGAAYVPAEPSFPPERIAFMMEEADVACAITEREHAHLLDDRPLLFLEDFLEKAPVPVRHSERSEESPALRLGTACSGGDPSAPALRAFAQGDGSGPAYILYTSGTTGVPKGVVVENRNVCHYARAFVREFGMGPGDVMLQYSVCSFDIFVEEVFASLLNGAAVAIPTAEERVDLGKLMSFCEEQGVTVVSGFPYLLADLNAQPDLVPASVRLLIAGGDVLRARFVGKLLDRADVYNTYGPSEATVCCTYFRCNGREPLEDGTFPVGDAVLGAQVRVCDGNLREAPVGEVGEICIWGGGVARGYLDAARDEGAFARDRQGARVYRSGDMGRVLPTGEIAFLHRKDSQVMILGRRVEVAEVESVLNTCDGVRAGVVRARRDASGLHYLTAYIVPEGPGPEAGTLRKQMGRKLVEFMIPEFFVLLDELPLNANGKPDSERLPVVLKEAEY